jgi:hypothetical protein
MLYDANLFVAYATPTDQSPFAIRHSLPFTLHALRFTTRIYSGLTPLLPLQITQKHLEVREFGISFIAKALDDLDCRCRVRSVCCCHLC